MQTIQQHFQTLYVAWQQPQSRRYYPVARLIDRVGHEELFEFSYINGALEAATAGFQPFPAFPKLEEVYRSKELFPFFTNRLMSTNRPDYPTYLQSLGLETNADPMLVLARSGGGHATDLIEMFSPPVQDEETGTFPIFFWMHGFRYLSAHQQQRLLMLKPGERLSAVRQINNAADPNAVQLQTADGTIVGYVPRYLANGPIPFFGTGLEFLIFVERVNQPPLPSNQRLLCRLEANWPEDHGPFTTSISRFQQMRQTFLNALLADPANDSPASS